jgi:membrane fusion protein, multidrug efflux system
MLENEPRSRPAADAAPAPSPAGPAAPPPVPAPRRNLRRTLLLLGPLVALAIGLYAWLTGGRYVDTDNAYVKAEKVAVSARVEGPIAAVAVAENQVVAQGDVLFTIDPGPFRLALDQARAALDQTGGEIEALKASYAQKQAELKAAEADAAYARTQFTRQSGLASDRFVSAERLDAARHDLDTADHRLAAGRADLRSILAGLGGDPELPVAGHPRYLEGLARRDQAALDLADATVRAPIAGIASQTPDPGQWVEKGAPVMAVVASQRPWVEANFKETELTRMRPGQPVTFTVDTYPGTTWHGTVESISPAAGAEFSLLPAESASGNWVKVVRRIPVRIHIDPAPGEPALRAGMSAEVTVDTGPRAPLPGLDALFARLRPGAGPAPVAVASGG